MDETVSKLYRQLIACRAQQVDELRRSSLDYLGWRGRVAHAHHRGVSSWILRLSLDPSDLLALHRARLRPAREDVLREPVQVLEELGGAAGRRALQEHLGWTRKQVVVRAEELVRLGRAECLNGGTGSKNMKYRLVRPEASAGSGEDAAGE